MSEWGQVQGPRAAMRFVPPFVPITVEIKGCRNNRIEYTWPNEGPAWARPPGGGGWRGLEDQGEVGGRWQRELHSGRGGITGVISFWSFYFCLEFCPEGIVSSCPKTRQIIIFSWILLPNSICISISSLSSRPRLSLSADCLESKWQRLSLNTKHRSHAELTPQVFTLSVHRAWLPSASLEGSDRSPRGVRY